MTEPTVTPRIARMSFFSKEYEGGYPCRHPWADDCFVQGGDSGIVFVDNGEPYTTAFFEAFPRNPNTFLRGEGKTVEEAETAAWAKFQKYQACPGHEFEKRGYTNGAGFCKHCNMFGSNVFPPWEKCVICGDLTYYTVSKTNDWYCENHKEQNPDRVVFLPRTKG